MGKSSNYYMYVSLKMIFQTNFLKKVNASLLEKQYYFNF